MTQEEKARAYDEALETARKINSGEGVAAPPDWSVYEVIFPELRESEDERIKKHLIEDLKWRLNGALEQDANGCDRKKDIEAYKWGLALLEKQGNTNKTIDSDEFAQGVLRGAAINLITWIDYNMEGNMCLSNVQCKEIVNALVKGDWDKIYAYMKKLEK